MWADALRCSQAVDPAAPAVVGEPPRNAADTVIGAATVDGGRFRLKACEADTYRWVYYDRSPAGRGRAKMRAYREGS